MVQKAAKSLTYTWGTSFPGKGLYLHTKSGYLSLAEFLTSVSINIKVSILENLILSIWDKPQESVHFTSICTGSKIIYGSTNLSKGQRGWGPCHQSCAIEGNRGRLKLASGSIIPLIPIHSSFEGRHKRSLFTP